MKKPVALTLTVASTAAVALVLCLAYGVFSSAPQHAAQSTPIVMHTNPSETTEPTVAATAEPIPTPAPLGIEKQALTFAELAPTITMSFEELVGDNGVYEDETEIPPLPSSDTYKLVINEYWQFAAVYAKNENGEYTVPVRYMIVTTGARDTPTPKGTFQMDDNYVRFGLFSVGVYGQYWRQITGAIYTHSLLYLHRDADTYTSSYSHLGTRGSHGCVRMMVPDARWVYYNIAPGTTCEIIKGDRNDEEAAAIKAQLIFPGRPSTRPSLAPGGVPVTEAWPGWQGNAYAAYQEALASPKTEGQT